ncbi:MAG: YdiU family protein [Spongiibacteraceae bacterium]
MLNFDNSYSRLPERFFAKVNPEQFSKPELIAFNRELAKDTLGLDLESLSDEALADLFTGQMIPEGATPIAMAYAGHQFGNFSHQLGDGRAILLGEIVSPQGQRFDIQLKGAGRTPFSRGGDGKAALGPVIREYILSEAMHALGVPTTRALAATTTGDKILREQILPGGVVTRVAASHIRVGTFEFFSARSDFDALETLANYCINRHYPFIAMPADDDADSAFNIYLEFLQAVAHAQACMVAKWMSLGFIHGVMNTDNMSISGETIDYGPCAFMDNYAADRVFSSIDRQGRYAYNNQIPIAKWNLIRLANCLLPLIHEDEAQAVKMTQESLDSYFDIYEQEWLEAMTKKIGIFKPMEEDRKLIDLWLNLLAAEDLDFSLSFRALSDPHSELKNNPRLESFYTAWQERLNNQTQDFDESIELMNSVNPVFIPRNHQVERAIEAALQGDFSVFNEMNECLKSPYQEQPRFAAYRLAPKPEERVAATFCGT